MRLFYATDLRGSTRCFAKALRAPAVYDADVVVLGGNLSGRELVPITAGRSGWTAVLQGRRVVLDSTEAVAEFRGRAADTGAYTAVLTAEEIDDLDRDPDRVETLFEELASERLQQWVEMADRSPGVRIVLTCGPDDPPVFDRILDGAPAVQRGDAGPVALSADTTLISTSRSHPTPWQCRRELTEDALRVELAGLAHATSGSTTVLHVPAPPFDSDLDSAPLLHADLTPRTVVGQEIRGPTGSHAVREFIDEHAPAVSLHGLVLDGRGAVEIGSTLCVNPGSEFSEGVLRGGLIDLDPARAPIHILTSG